MSKGGEGELGTSGRFIAAGSASVISAIVVNPFDVVKVRIMAYSLSVLLYGLGT